MTVACSASCAPCIGPVCSCCLRPVAEVRCLPCRLSSVSCRRLSPGPSRLAQWGRRSGVPAHRQQWCENLFVPPPLCLCAPDACALLWVASFVFAQGLVCVFCSGVPVKCRLFGLFALLPLHCLLGCASWLASFSGLSRCAWVLTTGKKKRRTPPVVLLFVPALVCSMLLISLRFAKPHSCRVLCFLAGCATQLCFPPL